MLRERLNRTPAISMPARSSLGPEPPPACHDKPCPCHSLMNKAPLLMHYVWIRILWYHCPLLEHPIAETTPVAIKLCTILLYGPRRMDKRCLTAVSLTSAVGLEYVKDICAFATDCKQVSAVHPGCDTFRPWSRDDTGAKQRRDPHEGSNLLL